MRKYLFPLLALLLASPVHAADTVPWDEAVAQERLHPLSLPEVEAQVARFPQPAFLTAQFTETKNLPSLSHPLVSKGVLYLESARGLLLQRQEPFPMTTLIADGQVWQWLDGGEKEKIEEPFVRVMAENLQHVLSGRYDQLFDEFSISGRVADGRWVVALQPRSSMIRKYFAGLIVHGGEFITQIDIYEGGGTHTRMTLDAFSTKPTTVPGDALAGLEP